MLIDANSLDPGARFDSEVCIVGAGAAGITLARTLARHGINSALLESGGMTPEADTQKLYDVMNLQPKYAISNNDQLGGPFSQLRLRYFGGTTNVWGGMCRPLDAQDFLPHPWVRDSGWPIRRADLDPYYPEAMSILDIPPGLYTSSFEQLAEDITHNPYLLGQNNPDFEPLVWLQSSPTTRMSTKYGDEIRDSARIRCYLHANATEFIVNHSGSRVTSLKVRTLGGKIFTFVTKVYVLCAGGLENPRLLLLSDSLVKGGLGNRHDLVGRYLMEHPSTAPPPALVILPPNETGRFQEEEVCERSRAGRLPGIKNELFGFAARENLRREHQLLGCAIDVFGGPQQATDSVRDTIRDLLTASRITPTSGAAPSVRVYSLFVLAEQSPNRDSRLYLGTELDALGQRKTVVDLRLRDQDWRSIRLSLDLFARALGSLGRGRIQLSAGQSIVAGSSHDMGTTRMADDPTHGVTDRHGAVHGIENVFLAGASLFPTSGFANPTLTIVALTLRLADRLKDIIPRASLP